MEKNFNELKKKVLELCDTIDKQNDLIKKYQKALEIAARDLGEAVCKQHGKTVECVDCEHRDSCEVFPKYGERGASLCGEVTKRVIEDRVKKAMMK